MTIISHIFNEEFLLPFWIKHHLLLCDKAIIIDYNSTDSSLDIIRTLAPHWEIRQSKYSEFDSSNNHNEVIELEREISGWKMCLNATEFLLANDLESKLKNNIAIKCRGAVMTDNKDLFWKDPDPNKHLVAQRTFGYFEDETNDFQSRGRILHPYFDGQYTLGRHSHSCLSEAHSDVFIYWARYSPLTQKLINRKIQIDYKRSDQDKQSGRGWEHGLNQEQILKNWEQMLERTHDLRENKEFLNALKPWEN
jgi:hypothetical protein